MITDTLSTQISLPMDRWVDTSDRVNPTFHAAVPNMEGVFVSARTLVKLKAKVKETILEILHAHVLQEKNLRRWAIGTGDGHVLYIRFEYGSWGYSILGPDMTHGSGCVTRVNFEETRQCAVNHAEQCYGGITWQHSAF